MPVKLEHLTAPTAADWQDLDKIINETAPRGLVTSDQISLRDWINDDRWVIGARFNDRIIGALLAERSSQDTVLLSAPGVRAITQRRGVMHQLIHFLQRWADGESLTLEVDSQNCDLREALFSRGFSGDDSFVSYN